MANTIGVPIETEVTLLTVTWDGINLLHPIRSLRLAIPVQTYPIIHERHPNINLKVMTHIMFVQVLAPVTVHVDKVSNKNIDCVNDPIQNPTEDLNIIPNFPDGH